MIKVRLGGVLTALVLSIVPVSATTIGFEQFSDSQSLTNQIPGVTFANTTVLTAGISLNELEFPPHSGQNVASDTNAPIELTFSTPINSFSGYFTYIVHLAVQAYSSTDNLLASAYSLYSANYIGSGVANSSPNEFLQVGSAVGFTEVVITGDPAGSSFVVDDISFASSSPAVPEPASLLLFICGALFFALRTAAKKSV